MDSMLKWECSVSRGVSESWTDIQRMKEKGGREAKEGGREGEREGGMRRWRGRETAVAAVQ